MYVLQDGNTYFLNLTVKLTNKQERKHMNFTENRRKKKCTARTFLLSGEFRLEAHLIVREHW